MSAGSSIAEQASSAASQSSSASEQAAQNLADTLVSPTIIENASYAWLPILEIVLITLILILALIAVWVSRENSKQSKTAHTILVTLWAAFFIGIETLLANFAASGSVSASTPIFIAASVAACLGGLSAVTSKMRSAVTHVATSGKHVRTIENKAISGITRVSKSVLHEVSVWIVPILAIIGVTILSFVFLEMLSNTSLLSIEDPYMECEISIISGAVVGCWFLFQRRPIGLVLPMAACLLYGLAEYFVESFKNSAIMPSDLRNASTGLNVANGYQYDLTTAILFLITMFCIAVALLCWLRDPFARLISLFEENVNFGNTDSIFSRAVPKAFGEQSLGVLIKNVAIAIFSAIIGIIMIMNPISAAMEANWKEEGIQFNYWDIQQSFEKYGIIPSFIAALQLEELVEPAGYTSDEAANLQAALVGLYDEYVSSTPEREEAVAQFDEIKPNVILIMNESFSDLSFLDGLGVGYEGPEFLNSLDTIAKGATSVSVYGGGTCNSEFEGLTGTSLGYIGEGINPYSLYDLSTLDALPNQFKKLGYQTTAIHPQHATNWRRDVIYPEIGFDEFIDRESFHGVKRFRRHVRDFVTYDMAIDKIESSDEPQFIFDLTMMGHGGYDTGRVRPAANINLDFKGKGVLDAYGDSYANEYLSSVKMSDKDLEHLISRLSEIDEPTVVAFYGDHQPGFTWWFRDKFADTSNYIAYQQTMFKTDYFVWANYHVAGSAWDAEDTGDHDDAYDANGVDDDDGEGDALYEGTMAPANIMGWTKNFIGAPLSDYEKASYISRRWVQSNNIYGYMDAANVWHPMSDAIAIAGNNVYEEGMEVISKASENGLPKARGLSKVNSVDNSKNKSNKNNQNEQDELKPGSRQYQDAVMVNVMDWITYLNFAELLQ